MKGRKPELKNLIPMRPDGDAEFRARQAATSRAVRKWRPKGLTKEEQVKWRRVATLLAEPTVDRLEERFVDVVMEYVHHTMELRALRAAMPEAGRRFYRAASEGEATRNGVQLKSHPNVAQFNASFARWLQLVTRLGLSPQDERNMLPGQGDLFDEADRYFS
jgi:phage terminase small subunit